MFKRTYFPVFVGLLLALMAAPSLAIAASSGDSIWTEISDASLQRGPVQSSKPNAYRTFNLNKSNLLSLLDRAPVEFTDAARERQTIITLPMPDGTFARFSFEHSLVVEPGLLKQFPELGRTYRGQGVDDPTATARFDFLPSGFHAIILSSKGTVLINPYDRGDTDNYLSYKKSDSSQSKAGFSCEVGESLVEKALSSEKFDADDYLPAEAGAIAPEVISGTQLRTYRLAVAATTEYSTVVASPNPPTVAATLAAQVLIVNRVNSVYERDVAVHMNIIANNNLIVYIAEPDPYTDDDPGALLTQNQSNVTTVIGSANYDVGHVFTTGGGGVATLNGPCNTSTKARGVTGLPAPFGDDFAIDFVAHEMGHQFGGPHTFNASCGGNRSGSSAYEPGSGVTIMGYAGVCGAQDLALHSIDSFHVRSIEQLVAFTTTGGGSGCAVTTSSGNTPPSVTGPGDFTIPKLTPFYLTASATDANGDSITYDWQEYDLGTTATTIPNTDVSGARPIFRPYSPETSGTRYFPSLQYILNNANVPPSTYGGGFVTGELMPQVGGRTMVFQVIARDNRANTGGVNTATSNVVIDAGSGPFEVTSPNTAVTYAGNSPQTVTWNVNNTTAAPVSAANVKISYSNDGGITFPTVLAASTANDGSETVTIPAGNTSTARIKVEAVGNIFFDISNSNFNVSGLFAPPKPRADFDGDGKTDLSVYRPSDSTWYVDRSTAGFFAVNFGLPTDTPIPGDYDGDGKADTAVYRPSATPGAADLYILNSNGFTFTAFSWGNPGDVPVFADYDGDGKTDYAVYRASENMWYVFKSNGTGNLFFNFGQAGDIPVAGDFDGDGKADFTVYRGAGQWHTVKSSGGTSAEVFGLAGDVLVPADYDGDNKDDIAVFRAGMWYCKRSSDGAVTSIPWGLASDIPAPGDYDGDGKDDQAVYRPSEGNWYMNRSTGGFAAAHFGAAGGADKPVPKSYIP